MNETKWNDKKWTVNADENLIRLVFCFLIWCKNVFVYASMHTTSLYDMNMNVNVPVFIIWMYLFHASLTLVADSRKLTFQFRHNAFEDHKVPNGQVRNVLLDITRWFNTIRSFNHLESFILELAKKLSAEQLLKDFCKKKKTNQSKN